MRRLKHRWSTRLGVGLVAVCLCTILLGSSTSVAGVGIRDRPTPDATVVTATGPSVWTTYGGGQSRSSLQLLNAPRPRLRIAWTTAVQTGEIYGEPLIYAGRVYVATERDEVVALDEATGRAVWTRSLGEAVPANSLPCGDIGPTVGITSTMVIDPATRNLFVSAATFEHARVRHVLFSLSSASGRTLFRRDLDIRGWSASAQLQRGALGLDQGRVLVAFGGNYGDCGSYHGYLMAVPETGIGTTLVYQVPSTNEAAVWAAAGMTISPNGSVYISTGNSASRSTFDMGNAVIELSPTLRVKSWFAPRSWQRDNAQDLDLGATAPLLLGNKRVFEIGKEAIGYLLSATKLGGIGGQASSIDACNARGSVAAWGTYVYVPCPDVGLVALRIVGTSMHVAWQSSIASGSPTVGGGVVWSVANNQLTGLSSTTGRVLETISAPVTEHFSAPAIANGLLILGGATEVVAYR